MFNEGMNLNEIMDEAKRQGVVQGTSRPIVPGEDIEETPVVGNDWMNPSKTNDKPIGMNESKTNDTTDIVLNDDTTSGAPVEKTPEYDGPGIVINNEDLNKDDSRGKVYTGITPDVMDHIEDYMNEMDDEIEELKAAAEERGDKIESKEDGSDDNDTDDEDDDSDNNRYTKDQFDREYAEAKIIIDKTGMGTVINFTDEEREKLERSKKIKLEEVETVSLNTIRTKKLKKTKLDNLIKKVTSSCKSNIVLPASGYTAVMRGCSAHELINLIKGAGSNNTLLDLQTKWSLIYDKIESTSLGKMEYNEFLLNTASIDMNVFIYGILCATYPDEDTIPLTCQTCKCDFQHSYTIGSLIRAEKMTDKLKELVMTAVDSSVTEEMSKEAHEKAPVSINTRIKLPVSGFIIDLQVQSAYDFINKTAKDLTSDSREEKYETAVIMSTGVNKIYIPDPDEEGSYFEIDGSMDIVKTIYSLSDTDNDILTNLVNNTLDGMTFEFGLMDITCPKCKHFTATIPMDLESVLFYKYQQSKTREVE